MKLDPGFTNHWKTERLIDQLGGDGVVAVLRLWGNAQIRRQFSGLELTPKRLAMETKWKSDAQKLFDVLTDPDAPWLDREPDGTFTIHGFEEHQHQVVKLWENGKKGGRPKKVSPRPSSKDSSSSSSSSSSPICEPNENHMVSSRKPTDSKIEEIYQGYPRKEGKANALKAIAKALRKNDHAFLLERTKAYASASSWKERQFIPHPATWFNEERFNDDPECWKEPSTSASSSAAITTGNRRGHEERLQSDHRAEKREREYPEPKGKLPRL